MECLENGASDAYGNKQFRRIPELLLSTAPELPQLALRVTSAQHAPTNASSSSDMKSQAPPQTCVLEGPVKLS